MIGEGGGGVQGGESAVAWGRESRNFKRDGALFWKTMKKVSMTSSNIHRRRESGIVHTSTY